jgi:hypothetical protein
MAHFDDPTGILNQDGIADGGFPGLDGSEAGIGTLEKCVGNESFIQQPGQRKLNIPDPDFR